MKNQVKEVVKRAKIKKNMKKNRKKLSLILAYQNLFHGERLLSRVYYFLFIIDGQRREIKFSMERFVSREAVSQSNILWVIG